MGANTAAGLLMMAGRGGKLLWLRGLVVIKHWYFGKFPIPT